MFLITSAWRGNLLALLTVTSFPERIHTFEGLQSHEPYNVRHFTFFFWSIEKHVFFQELPLASFSASLGFLVTESEIPIVKEIGKRTFFHGNYTWAALEAEANRLIMIDGTSYSQYLVRNRFTNRLVFIMWPNFKIISISWCLFSVKESNHTTASMKNLQHSQKHSLYHRQAFTMPAWTPFFFELFKLDSMKSIEKMNLKRQVKADWHQNHHAKRNHWEWKNYRHQFSYWWCVMVLQL